MDEKTKEIIVSTGKLLLKGYFLYMSQQGMTTEQSATLFEEAKKEFENNDPAVLPDA